MTYVDTDRLAVLLKEYDYAADEDLTTEITKQGDDKITRWLLENLPDYTVPETPPDALIDAATLYAAAAQLIVLTTNNETSHAVKSWRDEALEILESFKNTVLSSEDEPEPDKPIMTTFSV